MAQPISPNQYAKLLEPVLRKVWHAELDRRESLYKRTRVYNVLPSQRALERHLGIGTMSTDGWDYRAAGGVQYEGFEAGYEAVMRHRAFAKGTIIEREMMDDNLYPESGIPRAITERPLKLARNAELLREKIAAGKFNGAFTDSGTQVGGFSLTGPDGVGLCSAAHHVVAGDTAQNNEGTTALSHDAVLSTRQAMRGFTDDNGEPVSAMGDLLMVPIELEDEADTIKNSQGKPGTANNDANVASGKIKEVIVWDFLTDPTAWFLMDDMLREENLLWYERIAPEFAAQGDFDGIQAKFRGYFRCSIGHLDWRFVYGQNG